MNTCNSIVGVSENHSALGINALKKELFLSSCSPCRTSIVSCFIPLWKALLI